MLTVAALEYEEEIPEYEALPPDDTPPTISLRGPQQMQIEQRSSFTDPGAEASDKVDGDVAVTVTGLAEVDTSRVTTSPFMLYYDASDAAGNIAERVTREVHVASPCDAPATLCEEFAEELVCSSCEVEEGADEAVCLCLTPIADDDATSTVAEYVPPEDTIPPTLTFHGDGTLATTEDGITLMIHHVALGSLFHVPGVTAWDAEDGNLTNAVSSYGSSSVSTDTVTPPDAPYVITYNVQDSAGNAASELRRRVYVENPCSTGETPTCEADACTQDGGLCLEVAAAAEDAADMESEADEPPTIALLGPAAITVGMGAGYGKCFEGATLYAVCDRGATAAHPVDGNLDDQVLACSPDGTSYKYVNKGVEACKVDTGTPGVYSVVYEVYSSRGVVARVQRNVTVEITCSTGESPCASRVTCSEGGACLEDLEEGVRESRQDVVDEPPSLWLVNTTLLPVYLSLKQHSAYAACAPGQSPKEDSLCELGAEADDAEGGNLTARVLSCPPESCLDTGCPGHEFATKGIDGCLDLGAEPGSVLELLFVVFDDALPANMATTRRIITVAPPCETGYELCSDGVCSGVACEQRMRLLSDSTPDSTPPVLILLGAATLRLIYGQPRADLYLSPCASSAVESGCYATAVDDTDGDVSIWITVAQVTEEGDHGCSHEQIPSAVCYPGVYTYRYTVADGAGNEAVQEVCVELVEQLDVSAAVRIASSAVSQADAAIAADRLLNHTTAENTAFREAIAAMLNDGSSSSLPTAAADVTITAVQWEEDESVSGAAYELVNFTVAAVAAEADAVGSGRRMRRSLTETAPAPLAASPSAVEARGAEVASLIESGATSAEGSPAAMGGYLQAAAAEQNVELSSGVAGLSGNITAAAVSEPVDLAAAAQQDLLTRLEGIAASSAGSTEVLVEMGEELREGDGGEADTQQHLDLWASLYEKESTNVQALMDSMEQALENQEKLAEMAGLQEASMQAMISANEAALQGGGVTTSKIGQIRKKQMEEAPECRHAVGYRGKGEWGMGARGVAAQGVFSDDTTIAPSSDALTSDAPEWDPPAPASPPSDCYQVDALRFHINVTELLLNFSSNTTSASSAESASSSSGGGGRRLASPSYATRSPPSKEADPVLDLATERSAARRLLARKSGGGVRLVGGSVTAADGAADGASLSVTPLSRLESYWLNSGLATSGIVPTVSFRNTVIYGVKLNLRRKKPGRCFDRFPSLRGVCFSGLDSEPYGMDATFNYRSHLFAPEFLDQQAAHYNLSTHSTWDPAIRETVVHPFDPLLQDTVQIFFNASLGALRGCDWLADYRGEKVGDDWGAGIRIQELTSFLSESNFVTSEASTMHVEVLVWNANVHHYVYIKVTIERDPGGFYTVTYDTIPIDEGFYDVFWGRPYIAAAIACMGLFTANVTIRDLRRIRRTLRAMGRTFNWMDTLHCFFLTGAAWTLTLPMVFALYIVNTMHFRSSFTMKAFGNIYDDPLAVANPFLLSQTGGGAGAEVWGGADDTTALEAYSAMMSSVEVNSFLMELFWVLSSVSILALLGRLMASAKFHPRLGRVTRALWGVLLELLHLLFLLAWISGAYTAAGHLIYGDQCTEYASLSESFNSIFLGIFGGNLPSGSCNPLQIHSISFDQWVVHVVLFKFSYVLLMLWTLLNFTIAILVTPRAERRFILKMKRAGKLVVSMESNFFQLVVDVIAQAVRSRAKGWPSKAHLLATLRRGTREEHWRRPVSQLAAESALNVLNSATNIGLADLVNRLRPSASKMVHAAGRALSSEDLADLIARLNHREDASIYELMYPPIYDLRERKLQCTEKHMAEQFACSICAAIHHHKVLCNPKDQMRRDEARKKRNDLRKHWMVMMRVVTFYQEGQKAKLVERFRRLQNY
ncbi:hypothetical protein CYMTET_54090 [Cymbomonas tetramitiformis]|uniref:Pesticidal crystal protein Cry22Aa Ig-like domain-containing protein n=1 Tax=Cymbomonas tetramitiformis TaxID=36881 RepID=A0AAE0BH52_9CHLO|nr:hypothetical protein CYMTET_54090 [Cymbomonas tetramitiformis]